MKKLLFLGLIAVLAFGVTPVLADSPHPVTVEYGDITLPTGGGFFLQSHVWDLNECPVVVSYTLDLSGAPNVAYTGNYGQSGYVGLIWPGSPWAGAWMSGFLCDWANSSDEFPMFPDEDDALDMDDKFNMQRSPYPGSWSELMYDVYCATNIVADSPFGSWANYGIWFDRDGVDQYQAKMWGAVDGGTYNTGGIYEVQITYRRASETKGTACPLFSPNLTNPLDFSDPDDDITGIPTGFNRLSGGSGYADFPAGISFDTDETMMGNMRVVVWGNPGNGTIEVRDLTVTGCLATLKVGIDIKPGSDPNSINLDSRGVVPVAVLTTDDFDAGTVDPSTVEFAGALPLRWVMCDVDGDGDVDLLFHFKTQELELDEDSTDAVLTGETNIGQPIAGTDMVNIVPNKKGK